MAPIVNPRERNVTMLGTVMYATADAGLNVDDTG
jgi:hypothetical protein